MVGTRCCRDIVESYTLREPMGNAPFRGKMEAPWPTVFQLTRGETTPDQPIVVRRASGQRLDDVIWTTHAIPVIVSERVVNLLHENRFTGWATYPIVLYGKAGTVIPGYCGLSVTGRCGTADWSRSQRVLKEYPAGFFPVWRGLHIADWDGSDLFMSNLGARGFKFVTDRVRTVFDREHISNVEFQSIAAVETDTDPAS